MARFGAFLKNAFNAPKVSPDIVAQVRTWARDLLRTSEDTTIAVNEIACTDPSCPGIETVILVMEPGRKTRAYKVAKAIDQVTEQDLRDVLV